MIFLNCQTTIIGMMKNVNRGKGVRTYNRNFPGTDTATSDRYARDVAEDEATFIAAIREARREKSASLEAIAFLLGAEAAQLSRHLKGSSSTGLTNYLRIARALGYRCRIVLEKADEGAQSDPLTAMKIVQPKVTSPRLAANK